MTNAIIGHSTQFKIEDSPGAGTYTKIAEVSSINGPSFSMDTVDATNMDSTNRWREFIAGLKDGGEVSFDVNWDPAAATHSITTGLLQDFNSSSAAASP